MSARKRELNRSDDPPEVLRVPRLFVVRPGRAERFLCCSEKIWGIQTHWNPKTRRTVECTKPEKLCMGHAEKLPVRWKGVVTIIGHAEKEVKLLDLPPEAGAKLKALAEGRSLRGKFLLVQRETNNIRSRLLIELAGEYEGESPIPPEVDPTPTLLKIWGLR